MGIFCYYFNPGTRNMCYNSLYYMKKILLICNWGRNRSKYLAEYLEQRGYACRFKGVHQRSDNRVSQNDVHWADTLVFVELGIKDVFETMFLTDKKIVILNVDDRTEDISGNEWITFQHNNVYPKLKHQIEKHLPL